MKAPIFGRVELTTQIVLIILYFESPSLSIKPVGT